MASEQVVSHKYAGSVSAYNDPQIEHKSVVFRDSTVERCGIVATLAALMFSVAVLTDP